MYQTPMHDCPKDRQDCDMYYFYDQNILYGHV